MTHLRSSFARSWVYEIDGDAVLHTTCTHAEPDKHIKIIYLIAKFSYWLLSQEFAWGELSTVIRLRRPWDIGHTSITATRHSKEVVITQRFKEILARLQQTRILYRESITGNTTILGGLLLTMIILEHTHEIIIWRPLPVQIVGKGLRRNWLA